MAGLPEGWTVTSIQDLAENRRHALAIGPFGSNLKVSDYRDTGRPLVFVREIRARRFQDDKSKYVSEEKFKELFAHRVAGGDLLITKMGDPPGDVAEYPKHLPEAVITADCIKFSINTDLAFSRYALLGMQSDFFRKQVIEIAAGVAQQKVTLEKFRTVVIPLAPLAEQKVIADKLEALLAQVDTLKARLDAIPAILKRFRQSVLSAAVTGTLISGKSEVSEIPRVQPLADLVSEPLRNGKSVLDGDGFPVLRLSCLKHGELDFNESKRGTWGDVDPIRFQVKPGDFLVARGNGSRELVGRGGLAGQTIPDMAFPDTMIRIRPDQSMLSPHFLRYIWGSIHVREQIEAAAKTTAGIWKLSQTDIERIYLPTPTLREQIEIVRRVESLFAFADQIEARVQEATARVKHLTQSILAKAFRGELTEEWRKTHPELVTGPNSAEALLERIRAARAAAPETKGKRGRKVATDSDSGMLMAAEPSPAKRRGRPRII